MGYQPQRQPVPPKGYSGVYGFSGLSGYSGVFGFSGLSGYSGIAGYSGALWDEFDETFKHFDDTFKHFDEQFDKLDKYVVHESTQILRGNKPEFKLPKFKLPKIPKIVFYFLIPILMGSATILILRILEKIVIK